MPDFLHRAPLNSAPGPSASGAGSAARPNLPPKEIPAVKPTAAASQMPESNVPEAPPEIKKAPSSVWTEYYGAVFLLLVTVFIAVGSLLLRPRVIEYRRLGGAIQSAAALVSDERGYLESLQASIGAAQSIPPETLENVEEALPRSPGVPKMLQMLALFAEEYGATLSGIQFTSGGSDEPVTAIATDPVAMEINISVSLAGYSGLRRFLAGVERNMRIFDLKGITVSAVGEEGSGRQSYSFQLTTYFLPAPAPGAFQSSSVPDAAPAL